MPPSPKSAPSTAHPRRLQIPEETPLRRGVVAAFDGILAYAAERAAQVRTDPGVAVHEFRKSLRRARALLRMLRPALSRTARSSIDRVLKEAHRAASPLRDADVLLASVDRYQLGSVDGAAPAALRAHLEAGRAARFALPRVQEVLRTGVAAVRPLPAQLDRALPEELDREALLAGLEHTYRRARRELSRAQAVADEVHIHRWRKRTKDLVYQLEALASLPGSEAMSLRKPYSELATELGEVTDLIVLRRTLRDQADVRHSPGGEALEDRIDELLHEKLARALAHGAGLFDDKPKKLAKKVAKAGV